MDLSDLPYCVSKPGRPGGPARWYWQPSKALRAAGFRPERLPGDGDAARRRALALNAGAAEWRAGGGGPARPASGTLAALIRAYRRAPEFLERAEETRRTYAKALDVLDAWLGDWPAGGITPKMVKRFYGKLWARTPTKANQVLRQLRILYDFAKSEDMAAHNPGKDVKLKGHRGAAVVWPRAAVAHFVACADALGRPSMGDAVMVNEWLGQRQADALALPRARRGRGVLVIQRKTDARVILPLHMVPALAARIEAADRRDAARVLASTALIVSEETGERYHASDFRHWMRWIRLAGAGDAGLAHMDALIAAARKAPGGNDMRRGSRLYRLEMERRALARDQARLRAAGLELRDRFAVDGDVDLEAETVSLLALDFMHLRHTAVTRLAGAGCTLEEIAGVTGHTLKSVAAILDVYLVRTAALARAAFAKRITFEAGEAQ